MLATSEFLHAIVVGKRKKTINQTKLELLKNSPVATVGKKYFMKTIMGIEL